MTMDPQKWDGEYYDYSGECDLVLLALEDFANVWDCECTSAPPSATITPSLRLPQFRSVRIL